MPPVQLFHPLSCATTIIMELVAVTQEMEKNQFFAHVCHCHLLHYAGDEKQVRCHCQGKAFLFLRFLLQIAWQHSNIQQYGDRFANCRNKHLATPSLASCTLAELMFGYHAITWCFMH